MARRLPCRFTRDAVVIVAASVVLLASGCRRAEPPGFGESETDKPARPVPRTLAVAFWNLNWFPGRYPHATARAQASHLAAVLPPASQLGVDLLGLEEIGDRDAAAMVAGAQPGLKVDVCSEFLRGPEQKRTRVTRNNAGDGPAPEDTPPPMPADYNAPWTLPDRQQIALCSRLPVLATGTHAWADDPVGRRQRRGFVWAAYRTAPGEAILVYALHLKSNVLDEPGGRPTNLALREEASRQVLAHIRANVAAWKFSERLRLVVIGGDMNTSLDDPPYAEETTLRDLLVAGGFRWAWDGVPSLRRVTLPAKGRYPATCFDHVFYFPIASGGNPVRVVSATVAESGPDASDHRPVVVRFEW